MKGVKISTGKTEDTYVIRIAIDKSVDKTYRDELLSAVKRLTAGVPVARSSRRKKTVATVTQDNPLNIFSFKNLLKEIGIGGHQIREIENVACELAKPFAKTLAHNGEAVVGYCPGCGCEVTFSRPKDAQGYVCQKFKCPRCGTHIKGECFAGGCLQLSLGKKSTDDDDIEYVDVPSLPVRSLPVDVGMWREVEGDGLPDPVPHDKPFKDQARFLIWLAHVERNLAKCKVYKGSSTCRICGDWNGTKEYEYNGFRWPEGYSHYIEEHNVRPDKAFYDMIMSVE